MDFKKLFQRAVRPNVAPSLILTISVVDDDDLLPVEADNELDVVSGLALVLEYAASNGAISQRLISCRKLSDRAGVLYLSAFCHERQALRSFRVDRILTVFDPATGEDLGAGPVHFLNFRADETAKSRLHWGLSPRRRADLIALLTILIFIARCDERYHPLERDSLEAILARFWIRLELPGDPDFEDIITYADRLSPDGEAFWLSVHRVKETPQLIPLLRQAMREVVEADGILNPSEFYWVREVEEALAQ
jgi:uncharacterized tellurite resistance protein B-like protein